MQQLRTWLKFFSQSFSEFLASQTIALGSNGFHRQELDSHVGYVKQRDAHRSIHVSFVRIPSHATLEIPLTVLHFQHNPIGGAFISEVVYLDLTVLLQREVQCYYSFESTCIR
jgi:hypothetical protein